MMVESVCYCSIDTDLTLPHSLSIL